MFLEENNSGFYLNVLGMCDNSELIQNNFWCARKRVEMVAEQRTRRVANSQSCRISTVCRTAFFSLSCRRNSWVQMPI